MDTPDKPGYDDQDSFMFCKWSGTLLTSQWRGMRVGLLGGSFNPPHAGHLHISRIALRMLKLDAIWWLVSPQNPLKRALDYKPLPVRLAACNVLLDKEPRMMATSIEDDLGTKRSFDTLTALRAGYTGTDFIFLMGSDSAQSFHQWYRWREIPGLAALGILARPPAMLHSRNCPLKMDNSLRHIHLSRAESVTLKPRTCVWMGQHPLHPQSSSNIKNCK